MTVFEKVQKDLQYMISNSGTGDFGEGYTRGYIESAWRWSVITDQEREELLKMICEKFRR